MALQNKNVPKVKDESLIPKNTFYCYTYDETQTRGIIPKRIPCPYWDGDDERDKQGYGYCHFIEKGDWELGMGLLWDMCKECGISDGFEQE